VIKGTNIKEVGELLLSLIAYLSIFLFIGISCHKAYRFAKLPLHGRMELYPVPKEKGHKHGGSYYEEVEWWNKERHVSHGAELIEMLKEMLFIKKLFDNQRPLWWISYALHLGIYFLIAWTVLLVIGAVTLISGGQVNASAGLWGGSIHFLTALTGLIGLIIATFGSGMLLLRRLFDDTLRKYTTPQEYFNLALVYTALVTGIFVWIKDLSFATAREITANLITFTSFQANTLFVIHLFILFIMFTYIPLSKMSHYVGKYFTFHKVLWENDPNLKGSEVEKKIQEATGYKPTNSWSASHIKGTTVKK
jgi:nitrate reductase gamma subunit